jgi:hypothetical protein
VPVAVAGNGPVPAEGEEHAGVTEAMPQKAWATTATSKRSSAPRRESAVSQMATGAAVLAAVAAYVAGLVGITEVIARIRIHPATRETTMELTMPRGAARSALWDSSDMWAEASYPVKVYCAMRSRSMNT